MLSVVLATTLTHAQAFAQEQTSTVIEACADLEFKYVIERDGDTLRIGDIDDTTDQVEIDVTEGASEFTPDKFREAYEKAGLKYHQYAQCIFDKAVEEVVPDWFAQGAGVPQACIDQGELTEKLGINGNTTTLASSLILANQAYEVHLLGLTDQFLLHGKVEATESSPVTAKAIIDTSETFRELVKIELSNTAFALDAAFAKLKEMRQAYLMHVQLSCLLDNLKDYRDSLEKLRRAILDMEPRFDSASLTCGG